jgi:hypothetical protein
MTGGLEALAGVVEAVVLAWVAVVLSDVALAAE